MILTLIHKPSFAKQHYAIDELPNEAGGLVDREDDAPTRSRVAFEKLQHGQSALGIEAAGRLVLVIQGQIIW